MVSFSGDRYSKIEAALEHRHVQKGQELRSEHRLWGWRRHLVLGLRIPISCMTLNLSKRQCFFMCQIEMIKTWF